MTTKELISVNLERSQVAMLDRTAVSLKTTRSEVLRQILDAAMRRAEERARVEKEHAAREWLSAEGAITSDRELREEFAAFHAGSPVEETGRTGRGGKGLRRGNYRRSSRNAAFSAA